MALVGLSLTSTHHWVLSHLSCGTLCSANNTFNALKQISWPKWLLCVCWSADVASTLLLTGRAERFQSQSNGSCEGEPAASYGELCITVSWLRGGQSIRFSSEWWVSSDQLINQSINQSKKQRNKETKSQTIIHSINQSINKRISQLIY